MENGKKEERQYQILHIRISLGSKQTILFLWNKFA